MKSVYEIYSIRFHHVKTDKDMLTTTYTIGNPFLSGLKPVMPTKILLSRDKTRVVTYFDDDTKHSLPLTDDVEIFERKIVKEVPNENK